MLENLRWVVAAVSGTTVQIVQSLSRQIFSWECFVPKNAGKKEPRFVLLPKTRGQRALPWPEKTPLDQRRCKVIAALLFSPPPPLAMPPRASTSWMWAQAFSANSWVRCSTRWLPPHQSTVLQVSVSSCSSSCEFIV